ncbi:hypothetical protein COEREDRAFT_6490 [Coemansia reversa NRRL 1564]|uniref:Uncharacterized protein n=1 Tax=Coemansia reversa (strain ATCC 12441 / NRRL 1564) TaxID=763665 RepID=A0A2G5BGW1_COERN|nr:hypothetical protein COEREDRAFT_6490 [Coemansia reversa NRRL 1564]|eukprot:PIA18243.1 hypothetical protein COEREDRAFT_6490 [Coemansia reversa NRRL 1564]
MTKSVREEGSEAYYQFVFNVLVVAIEDQLDEYDILQQLFWCDNHRDPMESGRKPDGVFMESAAGIDNKDWRRVVIAVKIKGDKHNKIDLIMRGQLLKDFIDMAKDQPRSFVLGLGISGQGELCIYVSTYSQVY